MNLEEGKWPAFAIQDTVKNTKFPYSQDKKITHDDISQFVQDYVDGKVEASIKSEPIPEKQEGPVQVIVAHNYKDVVIENENDVLVEFYAPWCGHCKAYVSSPPSSLALLMLLCSLAPKYEELAAMYPTSSKVTIAKVDATANDVPDEIQGFPTIKLFPAGAKTEPLTYSGSRTTEDLAAFIKENGKYKVDAYEGKNDTEGENVVLPEGMGEAAKAATETVKSVASEATEAAKAAVGDSDAPDSGEVHDEL